MHPYCHCFILGVSLLSIIVVDFRTILMNIILVQIFIIGLISVFKLVKVGSWSVCRLLPYCQTFCFFHLISYILIMLIPQLFATFLIILGLFFHWLMIAKCLLIILVWIEIEILSFVILLKVLFDIDFLVKIFGSIKSITWVSYYLIIDTELLPKHFLISWMNITL